MIELRNTDWLHGKLVTLDGNESDEEPLVPSPPLIGAELNLRLPPLCICADVLVAGQIILTCAAAQESGQLVI